MLINQLQNRITLFSFFIALLFSSNLLSQNINFSARADAKQVPLGGYVEVSFTLQNAILNKPKLPDFRNFNVISGPNKGSSMMIVNGVKTEESTFSFTLQAKKLGVFTLAPAQVAVNGKNYSTNTLQIEVVKSSSILKSNQKTAFLALETAQKETYIGGQIELNLKLYSTITLTPQDLVSAPNLDDFYQKEMENIDGNPVDELIKGVKYQTKLLKKILLFPRKEGSYTITPFTISAITGDIFDTNTTSLQSNELIIKVKNLPENAPSIFNGAIGVLELESTISKNEATTDDALTMQVKITGKGNPSGIFAPKFKVSDSLELYEPKLIEESDANQSGKNLTFSKTFEYIIVPKYAGHYEIKPSLCYFDTETNEYETISISAHPVDIAQGRATPSNPSDVNNSSEKSVSFLSSAFAKKLGLALLAILALGGLFWWQQRNKKRIAKSEVITEVTTQKETELAVNQPIVKSNFTNYLDLAIIDLKNERWDNFYKNIAKTIIAHTSEYFNVSEDTFSRDVLLQKLEQSSRAARAPEAKELLALCDKMRFGGGQSDMVASEVLERAKVHCK